MNNNIVIVEKDMYCPYCGGNSAVFISETVREKSVKGCAALGIKTGCLLYVTGGCWAIVSGIPLMDVKKEYTTNLYGFCPCCGNTYPVVKPNQEKNVIEKFQDTKQGYVRLANQAKDLFNKDN